ncbi:hypothetical protein BGY98DRAFT_930852 [Russula aff. rugulosa BPL654]|nr:hypothetical protein BGY98DRAFT_930852 [Russula aff. rugulosa BPL654]
MREVHRDSGPKGDYSKTLTATKYPMKGLLAGPVAILNWSFPRADVSCELQPKQFRVALALRDEVIDVEKAGRLSRYDLESAIRRPIGDAYLKWAVDSFKLQYRLRDSHQAFVTPTLATSSHPHNDWMRTSSQLKSYLFKHYGYSNSTGPTQLLSLQDCRFKTRGWKETEA